MQAVKTTFKFGSTFTTSGAKVNPAATYKNDINIKHITITLQENELKQ